MTALFLRVLQAEQRACSKHPWEEKALAWCARWRLLCAKLLYIVAPPAYKPPSALLAYLGQGWCSWGLLNKHAVKSPGGLKKLSIGNDQNIQYYLPKIAAVICVIWRFKLVSSAVTSCKEASSFSALFTKALFSSAHAALSASNPILSFFVSSKLNLNLESAF